MREGRVQFSAPRMENNIPHHIALIPDGNRRWARAHGIQPWKGHEKGAERFFEIAQHAFTSGIPYVTLWAASLDNLTKRSKLEIRFLCSILRRELQSKRTIALFMDNNIRVRFIGQWKKLINDAKLASVIEQREKDTQQFSRRNLTVLFGYDGKQEMMDAIRKFQRAPEASVDYASVKECLWTSVLPPVDLVVRTGGELHWSAGFMMWHTADSQFYFTQKLWPDFDAKELQKALDNYAQRERRFGK